LLILFVYYDGQEEWFESSETTGYFALVLSACFQAFEITLEDRIFRIEKDLSALGLQQKVSTWKCILMLSLFAIGNIFPDLVGTITGSGAKVVGEAIEDMNESSQLYWFMFGMMFFNALAANLGM